MRISDKIVREEIIMARKHWFSLSLAHKCQLEFALAVLLIIGAGLFIPYRWMDKLIAQSKLELAKTEVAHVLERHFPADDKAGQLESVGVDVLICGAISRALANMVTASGIQLLPYVTGRVNDVLLAYLNDQLVQAQFIRPGCWPGARKGFGRRRRGSQWQVGRR